MGTSGNSEQDELRKVVAAQRREAGKAKAAAEKQAAAKQAAVKKAAAERRSEKAHAASERAADRPTADARPRMVAAARFDGAAAAGKCQRASAATAGQADKAAADVQAAVGSVASAEAKAALPAGAVPTREWIAEVLAAHDELRACHGVHTPIAWSGECFGKARKLLKEYDPSDPKPGYGGFDYSMSDYRGCEGPMMYGRVPMYKLGGDGRYWWSAKHAVRFFWAYGGSTGWQHMLRCSHVGAAISDCGRGFQLYYRGPFACKPTKAGEDMLSRRAIVALERKLAAGGERFDDVGCPSNAAIMERAWERLTEKVRISDRKAV